MLTIIFLIVLIGGIMSILLPIDTDGFEDDDDD